MHNQPKEMNMNYPSNALGWPEVVIQTDVGPVDVVFTSGHHAAVTANSGDRGKTGDVTYRGKHWYVTAHLFASDNWGENGQPGEMGGSKPEQFTEVGTIRPWERKPIAPTYRKAIMEAITAAVRAYVEANPAILVQAQRNHLQRKLKDAEVKVRAAYAAYTDATGEVTELQLRLRKLDGAQASG
jgi:hypothetical protein